MKTKANHETKSNSPQRRKGRKAKPQAPSMFGIPEKTSPFGAGVSNGLSMSERHISQTQKTETEGGLNAVLRGDSDNAGNRHGLLEDQKRRGENARTPQEKAVEAHETAQAERAAAERAAAEQTRITGLTTERTENTESAAADAQWAAEPCDCPGHNNGNCAFPDCLLKDWEERTDKGVA